MVPLLTKLEKVELQSQVVELKQTLRWGSAHTLPQGAGVAARGVRAVAPHRPRQPAGPGAAGKVGDSVASAAGVSSGFVLGTD